MNQIVKSFLIAVLGILVISIPLHAEIKKDKAGRVLSFSQRVGDMELTYLPRTGMTLSIKGTVIITDSSFAVVTAGWTEKFFATIAQTCVQKVDIKPFKGGKKIVLYHASSSDPLQLVTGTETYTMLPDNTFGVEFDLKYKGDKPAFFEAKIGGFNALPIVGEPFQVTTGVNTEHGVVPLHPVSADVNQATIARDFDRLTLRTRLGDVEVISTAGQDIRMFDYRKNVWAEKFNPIFWLGYLERPFEKDGIKYKTMIKFHLTENKGTLGAGEVKAHVPLEKVDDARIARYGQDFIMPAPKQISYTDSQFVLCPDTKIYLGEKTTSVLDNAVSFLIEELEYNFNLKLEVIRRHPQPGVKNAILLGDKQNCPGLTNICSRAGLVLPFHDEGYCLLSDEDMVVVTGNTAQGVFYGITTLVQLAAMENGRTFFKGAQIADYPALDFRGIHCFTGQRGEPQISKAIRDLMARYKINTLAWQCEYVNWDAKKGTEHPQYGMEKKEALKVFETAERYNIEMIPFISSLGHAEWMFVNDQNLELAEDPDYPYAYCPTNPKTYEFLFKLYSEVLDACVKKPRYFHIGHDEVTIVGRFPYRSKKFGKSATDLFFEDTLKIHEWFAKKDIKIAIWGDMLISGSEASSSAHAPNPEESRKRRQAIPKDVLICDWHYEVNAPEKYTSLKLFKDDGFDTLGATWYEPDNIRNMSIAAGNHQLKGILQTTWAGFNFDINNNIQQWHQYWAYLLAAYYCWTGDKRPDSDLDFCAAQLFWKTWKRQKPVMKDQPGYLFDLSGLYNRRLSDDDTAAGWMGYGKDWDLSSFPGDGVFGNCRYRMKENQEGESVVLLDGNLNPKGEFPISVTLDVGRVKAGQVKFLLNCAFRNKFMSDVGQIRFNYTDGTSCILELRYGIEIFAFNDLRVGPDTQIAWKGKNTGDMDVCVHEYTWNNPNPDKPLASIDICGRTTDSSIMLFAVTALQ